MDIADAVSPNEARALTDEDFRFKVLNELSRNTQITEQVYQKMFIDSADSMSIQTITTKNSLQIKWLWAACSAILTLLLTATLKNLDTTTVREANRPQPEQENNYAGIPKRTEELDIFMGVKRSSRRMD